ncbi:MAG TPA: lipid II flippase MurJ [Acidimicrobiia bacterium]|nr:lipid II flippase MurJ [Acidimicrobiia bacterium]
MTEPASVARAAAGMGIATAVSRGVGFVRILVIAAVLGTTFLGNAYQSSNAVGNVLFELLAAGALSAVLVPTFVEHLDRGDVAEAERLAGRILGVALVVLGAVALIGVLAAPWIARLLTAGVTNPAVAEAQRSLSTFLLRFVVPQVLLYAVGAVSVAVLYAKRRLAVTAMAPIGLTVVVVTAMGAFRAVAGPDPGLDLGVGEKLILALGATLGVAAFVGIPTVALRRSGFRLVPRFGVRDPAVGRVLRLSAWAVFQHSMIGLLLLAAIVVGNTVEGGTLAYQVAWVFFLAPYAVLAQPVHTAILPDLARQAGDPDHFASSLRWALDGMAVLVVPVAALLVAVALPIMRVAAFGQATRAGGVGLLAAGLASLAVGLYTYSAFLLFARAYYALGDSRVPALTALASAGVGITVMAVGGALTSGPSTVAVLGFGHTAAYAFGAIVLWVGLSRRTGHLVVPRSLLRSALVAAPLATCVWLLFRALDPAGRIATLGALVATTLVAGALYVAALRALGGVPSLHPVPPGPNPNAPNPNAPNPGGPNMTGPDLPGVEPSA